MKQTHSWRRAVSALSLLTICCKGQQSSLTDVLESRPELSNWTSYIIQDLSKDQLNKLTNIDLLAPTNDAFAKFLNSPNSAITVQNISGSDIWNYHIIQDPADVGETVILTTGLHSLPHAVIKSNQASGSGQGTLLSGLGITAAIGDMYQFNEGQIVEIDAVMQIPQNLSQTQLAVPQTSNLDKGFGEILQEGTSYTVFLPTNDAWNQISVSSLTDGDYVTLLEAHIVSGTVYYSLDTPTTLTSMSNTTIQTTSVGGTSLDQTFSYVLADIPLDTGVLHVIDRVLDPLNFTATTPTSTTSISGTHSPTPTKSASDIIQTATGNSSGLSTGAKAGIGVAVPLAVVAIVVIAFFLFRKIKRRQNRDPIKYTAAPNKSTPDGYEKPELVGGDYDPAAMARPDEHKLAPETITSPVFGHPDASEYAAAAVLMPQTSSHELSTSGNVKRKPIGQSASTTDGTTSTVASSETPHVWGSAHSPLSRMSATASPEAPHTAAAADDELTEEADTLVSELGVIGRRKKTLSIAAVGTGVKPEDVVGRKGEEYRELLERENRVRGRMEEVQRALGQR